MGTNVVGEVLYYILAAFLACLIVRFVLGWVMALSRYRPAGGVAALAEVVYSATDPVLRPLDRLIPPIRVGRSAIALSMPIAWITVIVLMQVARQL